MLGFFVPVQLFVYSNYNMHMMSLHYWQLGHSAEKPAV